MNLGLSLLLALGTLSESGAETRLETNEIRFQFVPQSYATQLAPWLKKSRIQKVTDRVSRALEWDIRRISATWYADAQEFRQAHGLPSNEVLAVTQKRDQNLIFGPLVHSGNFDRVFAHELTHVILAQKYKTAVPAWLEEGLANWIARSAPADRSYLKQARKQYPAAKVRTLGHPFADSGFKPNANSVRYHYQLSQAAIEWIAKRCDLMDLLQLSVGKNLETYLSTTCGISDLDGELEAWISR